MKRTYLSIVVAVSAVFVFAAVASAQSVTILGGGLKGQPYQFAVGLSKILKSKAGINATPQSAKGMVAQARIIAKGQAQFAWGLGGPVGSWAYKGEKRFKKEGPKKNLRAVLAYPFGQFQWLALADSGVMNLKDVKGKKVSVGSAASTTQTYARYFLPAHGLKKGDYKETTPGFRGGFGQLRNGNVAAHLTMGLAPMGVVQELAALKKIRLIDMDEAAVKRVVDTYGPGLSATTIAPGTYGKNQVNKKPVRTIFMNFGFSTSTHVSADTVYKVVKTLFSNLKEFHGTAHAARSVTLAGACKALSFPLHEGAKRYYKEVGAKGC
ncbi:MAG: TAXI family TRAP transporter solute-binding subunit [Nitrospinae bacterium]|nr:TAXI family TRAP transporter solute-binding subunit [Nitrospinota bacterium]